MRSTEPCSTSSSTSRPAIKKRWDSRYLMSWKLIHHECISYNHFLISVLSQVADLSMGDLLLHSTVVWINPPASLVKSKKDPELAAFGENKCGFDCIVDLILPFFWLFDWKSGARFWLNPLHLDSAALSPDISGFGCDADRNPPLLYLFGCDRQNKVLQSEPVMKCHFASLCAGLV